MLYMELILIYVMLYIGLKLKISDNPIYGLVITFVLVTRVSSTLFIYLFLNQ